MNFLVVDDEISIRQMLIVSLESIFSGVKIFEASNAADAIKLVQDFKVFDAVVTDFEMPGGNGDKLVHFLFDSGFKGKVILHTANELNRLTSVQELFSKNSDDYFYLQKSLGFREIQKRIKSIFNIESSKGEFNKIRIAYFLRYNKSLVDVFLNIDNRYLKIINKDDYYEKSDIDKYLNKNVTYLHVQSKDLEVFASKLGQSTFLFFDEKKSLENPEELLQKIHYVLKDIIHSVGVDKAVVELSETYFKSVERIDNKQLATLLFKFRNRRDYLYDHSFLTSCIANFILKKMPWYNTGLSQKLCNASLFHDIVLENSEIALVHDLNDKSMKNFSIEEIALFSSHPQRTCELLRNTKILDSDVENIILSHHEKLDGSGFPRKIGGKDIRRLTCVFILSHEFVRLMYIQNFEPKGHKDILTYLFNTYNTGNFKEMLDALYLTLTLNSYYEDN